MKCIERKLRREQLDKSKVANDENSQASFYTGYDPLVIALDIPNPLLRNYILDTCKY
jgi:hypothetical protein